MFATFRRFRRHDSSVGGARDVGQCAGRGCPLLLLIRNRTLRLLSVPAADAPDRRSFTDVSSGHANAGDIDCIAYYGITKGTSATTYSPLMSVTREHMALFLTRLGWSGGYRAWLMIRAILASRTLVI